MSKITFSEKDIRILQENPNVKRVSELSITYSDNFKRIFILLFSSYKLAPLLY